MCDYTVINVIKIIELCLYMQLNFSTELTKWNAIIFVADATASVIRR